MFNSTMNPITNALDKILCTGSIRTMEINDRIYNRNIPSHQLQPVFDIRPIQTKYTVLPTKDVHPPTHIPIKKEPVYNVEKVFNPGTSQSPWSGFATNINTESTLRNQFFALQRADQKAFIPSSDSELFNERTPTVNTHQEIPFKYLNNQPSFKNYCPNAFEVAANTFHNCTRQQIKNKKPIIHE